jgi:hypothetical protein
MPPGDLLARLRLVAAASPPVITPQRGHLDSAPARPDRWAVPQRATEQATNLRDRFRHANGTTTSESVGRLANLNRRLMRQRRT